MIKAVKWKAWLPKYLPNGGMLGFYCIAARLFRITGKKVAEHERENGLLLQGEGSPLRQGRYIENQAEWGNIRFGTVRRSNMAYSGCEILATYNARISLGEALSWQDMAGMIARYERKGAAFWGLIGTSPKEIAAYFKENGYAVTLKCHMGQEELEALGRDSDTLIVTAYNNRNDITGQIHTISITKDGYGNYALHNVYAYDRNRRSYVARGGYGSLQEAIRNMAVAPAVICVIGIRKNSRKGN